MVAISLHTPSLPRAERGTYGASTPANIDLTSIETASVSSIGLAQTVVPAMSAHRIVHLQNQLGSKDSSLQKALEKNDSSLPGTVNSRRSKRTGRKNHERFHNGIRYASASEAACGELMEKYIPNFKVIPLKTFQVPAYDNAKGSVKTMDFRIGDIIFEYHPARMWQLGRSIGEFETRKEYGEFRKELKEARKKGKDSREKIRQKWEKKLTKRYTDKRQALLEENPEFADLKLIVAPSPEEFYERIIKPLGKNIPRKKEFLAEFEALKRAVFENNQDPEVQEEHLPGLGSLPLKLFRQTEQKNAA